MYTFHQYFWLELTNTYTTKQSMFVSSTSFAHFVLTFLCNEILLKHQTYRPKFVTT